jgi:predicted nucleic acid-binding protein
VILTDTGPLVALVDEGDAKHAECAAAIKALPDEPLLSTWPCFTEAMHFARRAGGAKGINTLWRMQLAGDLFLHDLAAAQIERMQQLMLQYQDLPMDLADASIVAVAEQLGIRQLFTLDSDFRIYKLADGSTLDIVP